MEPCNGFFHCTVDFFIFNHVIIARIPHTLNERDAMECDDVAMEFYLVN